MLRAQSAWCLEPRQLRAKSPVNLVLTVQSTGCLEPSELGAYSPNSLVPRAQSTTYAYIMGTGEGVGGVGVGGVFQSSRQHPASRHGLEDVNV